MMDVRSPVIQTGIRAATPLAMMVGVYLLFAGHNQPGGGFAAGLVFGAVVTLRTVSGMRQTLRADRLIIWGVLIAAAVAVAPLFWGNVLLDQEIVETTLPLLDKVKAGSSLPFDIGVTLIVVGLIVALLDALSASALDADGSFAPALTLDEEEEI